MLKFNIEAIRLQINILNLNTSYVKVQLISHAIKEISKGRFKYILC